MHKFGGAYSAVTLATIASYVVFTVGVTQWRCVPIVITCLPLQHTHSLTRLIAQHQVSQGHESRGE